MRRKRSSRTERTAAGSTDPARTRRSFALPRRRGPRDHLRRERRRRHVEVDLGLLEGPEQRIEGGHRGQVEKRADRGRDRYSSMRRDVCGGQPLAVDEDAVAPEVPGCRRDGHLGHAPPRSMPHSAAAAVWLSTAPSPRASTPACHADSRSAGQVAEGEHAGVRGISQPASQRPSISPAGQPQRTQLRERDVAVLPRREPRDATSVISTPHAGIEVTFVAGSPPVPRGAVERVARRSRREIAARARGSPASTRRSGRSRAAVGCRGRRTCAGSAARGRSGRRRDRPTRRGSAAASRCRAAAGGRSPPPRAGPAACGGGPGPARRP